MGFGIAVFFGETEVNDVHLVSTLADAHEEVVGLDITVNEVARVDVLNARDLENGLVRRLYEYRKHFYQLIGEEEDSLK